MIPCDSPSSISSQDLPLILLPSIELCRVCGKKSAGYHYNVQTCHGCKSFFRRAVLHNVKYNKCIRNRECYKYTDSGEVPKKCHECRIRKCFSVGMIFCVLSSRPKPPECNQRTMTQEEAICGLIDQLSHLELEVTKFRKSAFNPVHFSSLYGIIESTPSLSLGQQFGPMPGWPLSIEEFRSKLLYLKSCSGENTGRPQIPISKLNIKNWLSFDITVTIEYAKTFNFFNQLSYNDKLLLVQATTFMNFDLMRIFDSYMNKYDSVHFPDGMLLYDTINATGNKKMSDLVTKITERAIGLLTREKMEKHEYLLLKAVVLCNNAVPGLSPCGQEIIQKERHKYCSALFEYCKTSYGVRNGPARFGSILSMVDVLERNRREFEGLILIGHMISKKMPPSPQSRVMSLANEIANIPSD